MNLYFHHVGQEGANEDFKKTVFNDVDISIVAQNIEDNVIEKDEILNNLEKKFTSGKFNCWGVPAGAGYIIRHLKQNDHVLLVESARIDGEVQALCRVEVFYPVRLNRLSQILWGDDKYPYIFFFDTVKLNLMWIEFINHLNYKENYNPRGQFMSVKSLRLREHGGVENYIKMLYQKYTSFGIRESKDHNYKLLEKEEIDQFEVNRQLSILNKRTNMPPTLTEDTEVIEVIRKSRDYAFSISVKNAYKGKCAICGSKLMTPNGNYEVESAHIYPKSKNGSDDIRNGISLCHLHHWAFDVGWISISDDYKILVSENIPSNEEYKKIYSFKDEMIYLPEDKKMYPHKLFLREHRKINGFV